MKTTGVFFLLTWSCSTLDKAIVQAFQFPVGAFSATKTTGITGTAGTARTTALHSSTERRKATSSSTTPNTATAQKKSSDAFVRSHFFSSSDCDNVNTPPSLSQTLSSLDALQNGSDLRGTFVNHKTMGSFAAVSAAIRASGHEAALTPFAAHCVGYAFASMVVTAATETTKAPATTTTICIGNDPRSHGPRLADAFSRGALLYGVDNDVIISTKYTGVATTPSMMDFCNTGLCDGAVMITASHLPQDRNGLKFFSSSSSGWSKEQVTELLHRAKAHAQEWQSKGILPPTTSGEKGVFCTEWVDYMPIYAQHLKDAIRQQVGVQTSDENAQSSKPLDGLKIVLNAGHGSGAFFHKVLHDLGADVSASIGCDHPDSTFPNGVPNPENANMVQETMDKCRETRADLGIMLDTDADRSGFIAYSSTSNNSNGYEPLHKNRLIALLGVVFGETSPGCTIVTDSCTSEGLSVFLTQHCGVQHERYLKGYANVIRKARELTDSGLANAEVAIETSGHCAMKENNYMDDGTYTAVKVISLLAKIRAEDHHSSLLDLIQDLQEMPQVVEFRMTCKNGGTLGTMKSVFSQCALEIQQHCMETAHGNGGNYHWQVDEDNLEGVRVRTDKTGSYFILRKSLHDPVMILQVEGHSKQEIWKSTVEPLLDMFEKNERIAADLDMSAMETYVE